ncbi:MAG: imelysin family protein [Pseudomonadota bacterium]
MRKTRIAALAAAASLWTAPALADVDANAVLTTYADIAEATYADSLLRAEQLHDAVEALVAMPDERHLAEAREAWRQARVPYQQSEAYRFGNPLVDDWEGRVNAWPLDEGLLDYVEVVSYGEESDENPYYTANVVANAHMHIGGVEIDASTIDMSLLQELHEIDGVEANVSTGYHAIEFMLWGQDLYGTGPGAGDRPATDFDPANCTGGNCDRRAAYLLAASELLIVDLQEMVGLWGADGDARAAVMDAGPQRGIAMMLTGLGSLSYGELAGERMKLGLMLHDPEEEHDCFSDNTHWSHFYDQQGMVNVYNGHYTRVDGSVVSGPSLADLVGATDPAANDAMHAAMNATNAAMLEMVKTAESGNTYDQMLGEGNDAGNMLVDNVVSALTAQTQAIENVVASLDLGSIEIEGSDSLDNPDAVFQ